MKENGYKGFTIWLTGPSGAGKTYLAEGLKKYFDDNGIPLEIFDGDSVRARLYPDIGFSAEARVMHNKVVINHARLMTKHGVSSSGILSEAMPTPGSRRTSGRGACCSRCRSRNISSWRF